MYVCSFCEEVLQSSELWKTGQLQNMARGTISDITHGEYFRRSRLSRPAGPGEEDDLRVGLILGYDDIEMVNPLGAARCKHKMACFYVALANLNTVARFKHKNICVLMLVREKVLKRCGAVRVVAGANASTGDLLDEDDLASFGAQFRASFDRKTFVKVWPPVANQENVSSVSVRAQCVCGCFCDVSIYLPSLAAINLGSYGWQICDYAARSRSSRLLQ